MGIQAAAAGVGIAVGPYLAATAVEASGDRRTAVPVAVVLLFAAAATLAAGKRWEA